MSSVSSETSIPSLAGIMDDADVFTMDHAERRTNLDKEEFREELEPDFSQAVSVCYCVCVCTHVYCVCVCVCVRACVLQ